MSVVSIDIRAQIPHLVGGRLTEEGKRYLEDVYRAKAQELAALRRMLGYPDENTCPECGFTRKRGYIR